MARWPSFLAVAAIGLAGAGLALVNPVGRMILLTPQAGASCDRAATVEGLDFHSAFASENQMVNGSMIRSLASHSGPDCTRIGSSYRCTQAGPTIVQIRLAGPVLHYSVPAGQVATIFGDRRDAYCVIQPSGVAG